MKSKPTPTESRARPWQPGSFRHAPHLAFALLTASLIISGFALFVVRFADGKAVDDWIIAPSVLLSILATLSAMMLRTAFHEGAETYWWALLLSPSGVKIHTLQSAWQLNHDPISRLTPMPDVEPVLRMAGIVLLLLATLGPLLQRAVVVELINSTTNLSMTLPIRREPMWNLTTRMHDGFFWFTPLAMPDDFARASKGLGQRTPIHLLSQDACPPDATCKTTVTVASFARSCSKEDVSWTGVPLLQEINFSPTCQTAGTPENGSRADNSSSEGSSNPNQNHYCNYLHMQYQLALDIHGIIPATNASTPPPSWTDQIPKPDHRWKYSGFAYTSYFYEGKPGQLTLRRCNFTNAYVKIPIEITNSTVVNLQKLDGDGLSRRNRGSELIPALISSSRGEPSTVGIRVTMSNLYAGYAVFDNKERRQLAEGMSPWQFVNQSSIVQITAHQGATYSFTFEDPVEAFTDTLHELSLRYALENIESTPDRMKEMDYFISTDIHGFTVDEPDPRPDMEVALRQLETKPSPTQQVSVQRTRPVAVYKANTVYAVVAVGISVVATLLNTLLFAGWRRLGRRFSSSPLEIARAFDAPLLRQAGSNVPGEDISKYHGDVKVRYGEAMVEKHAAVATEAEGVSEEDLEMVALVYADSSAGQQGVHVGHRQAAAVDTDVDAGDDQRDEVDGDRNSTKHDTEGVERGLMAASAPRLVIDLAERLSKPARGRAYF